MKKEFLEIGQIVGTHGVRGMLRVDPWCDGAEFLSKFKCFYTESGDTVKVERSAPHGNIALIKILGVDTVEQAEKLRGKKLLVKRSEIHLPKGRWFISELIGCEVFSADETTRLGKLTDVMQTGANDVWQITDNGKNYLVPAIEQVIVSVDIAAERIILNPMKGIFDNEN